MNSSHLGKVMEVSLPSYLLCFTNSDALHLLIFANVVQKLFFLSLLLLWQVEVTYCMAEY